MAVRESNVISNYIKLTNFQLMSFLPPFPYIYDHNGSGYRCHFTGALLVDYDDVKLLIL
jgi:hypothetical protein